ncbi:hypothetical protein RAZWK3B_00370 [Roseobacter sp. AzwK-3b]|nr:hypothetical protein RAZWK3B_00370 [Roseobacter sp. AzwK-3b]
MRSLEAELGLEDLTAAELDALAAAVDVSSSKDHFKAADIVKHPILANVSRATQYRAVQALEDKGFINSDRAFGGAYTLQKDAVPSQMH